MKHIMLDLETLGTGPYAVPISIGAVKFDSSVPVSLKAIEPDRDRTDETEDAKPPLLDSFHVAITPESCVRCGLEMDAATVSFWMSGRMAEARAAIEAMDKLDIGTVLVAFTAWVNSASQEEYQVWGNGATFDNVIIDNAYKKVLGPGTKPWGFRQDRCYRTMLAVARDHGIAPVVEDMGIAHTALSDALYQARHLQLIYEALGWQL